MAVTPAEYVKVPLARLRVGTLLRAPILDAQGGWDQLLLAAGAQITLSRVELLKRRGIAYVYVHQGELDRLTGNGTKTGTARRHVGSSSGSTTNSESSGATSAFKLHQDSFLQAVQRPQSLSRDQKVLRAFEQKYETSLASTRNVFEEYARDQRINPAVIHCVVEQQLDQIVQDLDVYVSLGLAPVAEGYPSRHSLQTSMLATSMGTLMGLNKEELTALSFGCLLHDAGLMLVPRRLLEHTGPLTGADRHEIAKHPVHIANSLNRLNDVSTGAKMVAYQMHERLNGSGYPRNRQARQIHPLAKIGAVADTYLSLVSSRPGCPGLSAYAALEKLLYATNMGLYDGVAVRALLHAVSLFPIGSSVELSDGRRGQVSRANREHYDRPVVEIISGDDPPTREIIDLSQEESLRIVSARDLVAV
ncbi:MAG: HD domain-containing phosphohydrolase [Planctomycetaceae bacterium]